MASIMKKSISKGSNEFVICPVELDLIYEVLDPLEVDIVKDAASCLAETFAGVEIDGIKVNEPMVVASKLSKDDMYEFILEFLKSAAQQGLCLIAREKETGRVVGVLASEELNPEEEVPVFEGNLEAMNEIIKLLGDISERFINTIQNKTGKKVKKGEYIHSFMGGARLATLKRFVIIKLFEMLIETGIEKGYKGIVGEATNPRSEKMCVEYCGFHLVNDTFNRPIEAVYADYEKFKTIPTDIARACKIVYRPLHSSFGI